MTALTDLERAAPAARALFLEQLPEGEQLTHVVGFAPHEAFPGIGVTGGFRGLVGVTARFVLLAAVQDSSDGSYARRYATARSRPTFPNEPVTSFADELKAALAVLLYNCDDSENRQWDLLLDLTVGSTNPTSIAIKAQGLARKGMKEAAVLAYDEALRDKRFGASSFGSWARYRKAANLIDLGEYVKAHREIARLHADVPDFGDPASLLEHINRPTPVAARREAIPEDVRHAVWRRDEGRCVNCGSAEKLEFDHIIPVSKGGANTERNLQLLCEPCNRSKGATV